MMAVTYYIYATGETFPTPQAAIDDFRAFAGSEPTSVFAYDSFSKEHTQYIVRDGEAVLSNPIILKDSED